MLKMINSCGKEELYFKVNLVIKYVPQWFKYSLGNTSIMNTTSSFIEER